MALPDTEPSDKKASDPPKGSDNRKEKFHTKVIVRRLPPSMDQTTFLNQISPVPTYDYMYLVKGDASLGENSFARAYINFTNPDDIYDFKEKFDNYVFLDGAGHEYPAVVEFSSFQKVPKKRNKVRVDPKCGSIESDPYYLEFVEIINRPLEQDEKPEYSYQITTENKNETTTPLLEYLKNRRAEKSRLREERREERKRKEFERKRFRDDERKKRYEERSPIKSGVKAAKGRTVETEQDNEPQQEKTKDKVDKEEPDRHEKNPLYYKNREKKYEDRRREAKSKYPPKKEYAEKRDYKSRREDYKEKEYKGKYDDYKKEPETKVQQKKVKKYSEKREERKMEAQKRLEQQTKEQESTANPDPPEPAKSSAPAVNEEGSKEGQNKATEEEKSPSSTPSSSAKSPESKSQDKPKSSKDPESQSQRRIRNKDRPSIAIYRPGMLSKRRQADGENKETKKE